MKKIKLEKGITLIALIITIIILLILAVVTIESIKDSNIITYAQNTSSEYIVAQEKEQIGLALSNWTIEKNIPSRALTFKDVMKAELGKIAEVDGDSDGPLTITMNNTGNVYEVTSDGTIEKNVPVTPLFSFPIEVQVGDNAILTWTNDVGGGKLTVTGSGATYDYTSDENWMDVIASEITTAKGYNELEGYMVQGVLNFALNSRDLYTVSATDYYNTMKTEYGNTFTEKQWEQFKVTVEMINKIEYILIGDGITSIGERQIKLDAIMTNIKLPNTLQIISEQAFGEIIFKNDIIIPSNVTTIENHPFEIDALENAGYINIVRMRRQESDSIGMTLPENFETDYNVTWGYTGD